MSNLIEAEWEKFKVNALGLSPQGEPAFKLCFYAGVVSCYNLFFDAKVPPAERRAYMQGFRAEMAAYIEHITRDASPGAPVSAGEQASTADLPPTRSTSDEPPA